MPTIKLLKEPGFIYDLNFIFCLKFNYNSYHEKLEKLYNEANITSYLFTVQNTFGNIPDDLYVFFHAIESNRSFFSTYYFEPYKEKFLSTYNFTFLQNLLSDTDALIENLIRFYFYNLSKAEIKECTLSKDFLFAQIKKSSYSSPEKNKLYEFFYDPEPYIKTLQFELIEKKTILDQYYEKNYQIIIDLHNKTSFQVLQNQIKIIHDIDYIAKAEEELYTSYCLINKFFINVFNISNGAIYLLGCDYPLIIDALKSIQTQPNLRTFGQAISDESRIKILQLLLERKEITRKDLERLFSFSGTTAYHHITLMTNAGLIKTRSEGKTIIYSLNRTYFDSVILSLHQYSTKEI